MGRLATSCRTEANGSFRWLCAAHVHGPVLTRRPIAELLQRPRDMNLLCLNRT